ncbi:MAG TPA: glucose-1-phosphate thymidylyltransferase [Nitrospinota bacterium]|nr:glucose-1-phosphate thymidylyltransferase [Nitrospinota bacterium]
MFKNFFLHLEQFEAKNIFQDCEFLWSPLKKTESFIQKKVSERDANSRLPEGFELQTLSEDPSLKLIFVNKYLKLQKPFISREMNIFIEEGVILEPTAIIKHHVYFGKNTEVRQGAYIRGNVIVGESCVVGHATEIKNAIMMNHSEAGHFAYIGDSIIGSYVNLGAGVKLANLQFRTEEEKTKGFIREIKINFGREIIPTQMEKLGAIIGDFGEIGCNTVTCPGALLESNVRIYPNINISKGLYKAGSSIQTQKKAAR